MLMTAGSARVQNYRHDQSNSRLGKSLIAGSWLTYRGFYSFGGETESRDLPKDAIRTYTSKFWIRPPC